MKELILGVRELQAHLGLALRTAQEGGRVVVTSHNRPIAQIQRVTRPPRQESALDRKLRRMAEEGRLRLGRIGSLPRIRSDKSRGLAAQVEADRR
ncbi:MAG: type II toxin-antitoxin system prevent-host-death family antitoxin [Planctomycetes bacterium]|nr:type II toxin-antitoxin system prevent-host-death family antitoxin [Planctomycetota bacterium]